jgi:DNA-binding LytR/AlgR family response regulator
MVVDDEPLAIDVIAGYLQKLDIHPVCCEDGMEALRQLQKGSFDLLFLDIEMPGLNGIGLLKSLPRRPAVVLTTAYRDYAAEGFELDVLDYLVKPFSYTRMQQAMEKFARWSGKPMLPSQVPAAPETLFLKVDKQLIQVPVKDILYVESRKDYVRVCTTGSEYLCHLTLTDITAKLPAEKFFRMHRSYTVSLDKISLLKDNQVHIGGKALPVSREWRMELKRRLRP